MNTKISALILKTKFGNHDRASRPPRLSLFLPSRVLFFFSSRRFMKWPETLIAVLFVSLEAQNWDYRTSVLVESAQWTTQRKIDTRYVKSNFFAVSLILAASSERTRDLWYHGYNSYMQYGVCFGLYKLSHLNVRVI